MSIFRQINAAQPSRTLKSKMNVREALKRAHDCESELLDTETERVLTNELNRIWIRVQAQPNTFTMNQTEFSVFNRYRSESRFQNETARKAVERYWNSKLAANSH